MYGGDDLCMYVRIRASTDQEHLAKSKPLQVYVMEFFP